LLEYWQDDVVDKAAKNHRTHHGTSGKYRAAKHRHREDRPMRANHPADESD